MLIEGLVQQEVHNMAAACTTKVPATEIKGDKRKRQYGYLKGNALRESLYNPG